MIKEESVNHMSTCAFFDNHKVGEEISYYLEVVDINEGPKKAIYIGLDKEADKVFLKVNGEVKEFDTEKLIVPGALAWNTK